MGRKRKEDRKECLTVSKVGKSAKEKPAGVLPVTY